MENKYFVWKDRNCNGINPEWRELTPREYYAFVTAPENKGRFFIDFNADCTEETSVLMMEVTAEEYADWDRRRHRFDYRQEMEKEFEDSFVSLDQEVPCTEGMLFHDVVADPDISTEGDALHHVELSSLRTDLTTLTSEERKLIDLLYLNNPECKTERAIARELGLPQKTLNNRKKAVLKKFQ